MVDSSADEKNEDGKLDVVEVKPVHPIIEKATKISHFCLNNSKFTAGMTVMTIWALFGDDFKWSFTGPDADGAFDAIAFIALLMFGTELTMSCLAKPNYYNSFYFWLDVVSTVSLVPDITFLWKLILGEDDESGAESAQALKAGRASRAGTKASRIIRIVRLVRMVRIVKLYKMHGAKEVEQTSTIEPSKVGKKLTEMTTRRLICMILAMVLVLPFMYKSNLANGKDPSDEDYLQNGLWNLHLVPQGYNESLKASGNHVADVTFRRQIEHYAQKLSMTQGPLLYLSVCPPPDKDDKLGCYTHWEDKTIRQWVNQRQNGAEMYSNFAQIFEDYRTEEVGIAQFETCYDGDVKTTKERTGCTSTAVVSIRHATRQESGLNIVKTCFIMILLTGGAIFFSKDAQLFVIGPIERMMELVKKLADNPLESATMDKSSYLDDETNVRNEGYETALLESTLERVGLLLQIGFGAAGAAIIGKNMASGSGKLNAMVPGKKITAIYGFCDIRQFTDTTECLQEEVMVYVNKLGNIVHSATHMYYGMANKNVGDAFLLSWKICDGELDGFTNFNDEAKEEQRLAANDAVRCPAMHPSSRAKRFITPSAMADSSIHAFLKCIIDLENENDTGCLAVYATYEAVLRRFGPGFRIKMGFGMHVGWAIEGAIGSELKIDATYLSPHVEMSDRLEAASKIFGAKLNISHWLVNLTSPSFKKLIRPVDCITVEGVPCPLTVYTYDVMNNKPKFGTQVFDEGTGLLKLTNWDDAEFVEIQNGLHPSFLPTYRRGWNAYFLGDWEAARGFLEEALVLKEKDGPTMFVLNVMEENKWMPPEDWKGHHKLDEF